MIDIENQDRIIGDFFELNADLVKFETESSLPKFIKKHFVNNKRKKMIKMANKLLQDGIILSKENVRELLVYIKSEYPNEEYNCIKIIKGDEDYIEAVISYDTVYCVITLDNERDTMDISLTDSSDKITGAFSISRSSLTANNKNINGSMEKLNKKLVEVSVTYITDTIKQYIR